MSYDELKKGTGKIFNQHTERGVEFEKIPQLVRRCPKCRSLALEFDTSSGRIYCTRCGFEEHIKQVK